MSTAVTDIHLTAEQERTIVTLTNKLQEPAFGKLQLSGNADDQPQLHLIEWMMYLLQVAIEGTSVRANKKKRTTAKRRTHLRKLQKLSGHYPTNEAVGELFGQEASEQADLITLLQADIRQLQEYKPTRKSEVEKIRESIQKLQQRLQK